MFKVLVIAYYFPPMGLSGVQRTLKFVKYMKNYNWEPTVFTTGNVGYFAHDESLYKELNELKIRVIRTIGNDPNTLLSKYGTIKLPRESIRKTFNKLSQTFFIPDNKTSWSKQVYKLASKLMNKETFDAIYVTIPPYSAFMTAAKLKNKFNVPLFVDYRDMWYDSYLAFYPTPVHKYLNKKYEYNSLKAADRVIVTNRKIKEKLINTYQFLTFDDIVILPHGFDPEDFEYIPAEPKLNHKMRITYSGIFYAHNTAKYFLKAFKKLVYEKPEVAARIELHFVGYLGKQNERLVRKLNLQEYVVDQGYLTHSDAIGIIKSSDVLWMMLGKWKYSETIAPGKLYEYFGSQKPIIGCVPDGVAKTALQDYEASFICPPDDIEKIKESIFEAYKLFIKKELPVPDPEKLIQYRRDYLTEQLIRQ
ncbi:MAG TPA: glycosyl transferase family 1, partial [Ignavibacteriales bacterium]|nr:glycosyl transferase family 1 [Ignavibacteriales bacterium]